VGARPVKAVATEGGGLEVLVFDWDTGEFVRDMSYLSKITFAEGEVDVVTEEEFERAVASLRAMEK
jgi:hypothetical protein